MSGGRRHITLLHCDATRLLYTAPLLCCLCVLLVTVRLWLRRYYELLNRSRMNVPLLSLERAKERLKKYRIKPAVSEVVTISDSDTDEDCTVIGSSFREEPVTSSSDPITISDSEDTAGRFIEALSESVEDISNNCDAIPSSMASMSRNESSYPVVNDQNDSDDDGSFVINHVIALRRKQRLALPVYSLDRPPNVYGRRLLWTGRRPFDSSDEEDCEANPLSNDVTSNPDGDTPIQSAPLPPVGSALSSGAASVANSVPQRGDVQGVKTARIPSRNEKTPGKQKNATGDDRGMASEEVNMAKRRKISHSDDEDLTDSTNSNAASMPVGLIKPCSIVLERLPEAAPSSPIYGHASAITIPASSPAAPIVSDTSAHRSQESEKKLATQGVIPLINCSSITRPSKEHQLPSKVPVIPSDVSSHRHATTKDPTSPKEQHQNQLSSISQSVRKVNPLDIASDKTITSSDQSTTKARVQRQPPTTLSAMPDKTMAVEQNSKPPVANGTISRIPKVSPSKRAQHVTYVSPLNQGQNAPLPEVDASAIEKRSALQAQDSCKRAGKNAPNGKLHSNAGDDIPDEIASSRPAIKDAAAGVSLPVGQNHQRRSRKMRKRQQQEEKHISVPLVANSSENVKKSILKKMIENGVDNGVVARNGRRVTFSNDDQIKYIEPRKTRDSVSTTADNACSDGPSTAVASLSVEDEIISAILKWNPDWLREATRMLDEHKFVELPPIAQQWPLVPLQKSYSFVSYYIDAYKVLLLHETWEKLFREYVAGTCDDGLKLDCIVVTATTIAQTFKDFNIVALVDKDDVDKVQQNVLVTFRLVDRKVNDQQRAPVFFGLIWRAHESYRYRRVDEVTPELRKCANINADNVKRFCHMEMTIRARSKTNLPAFERGLMLLQVTSNISTTVRLVVSLASVKDSPLQPVILTPNKTAHPSTTSIDELLISTYSSVQYYESQLKAVSSCMSALNDVCQPIIRLISGPAESGKSQAIVGLIEEMQQRRLQSGNAPGVILVTSPTSKSVNELSRKIIALNRFYPAAGQTRFLKFVRLGGRASLDDDIARYCMETLLNKNMSAEKDAADILADEQRSEFTERLAYLRGQLFSFTESQLSEDDQARQQSIENEINELQQKITSKNRRTPSGQSRKHMKNIQAQRRSLICHAHVIACCLNEDDYDLNLLKEMHRSGAIKVLCVIIDDANKATELETLVAAYAPIDKLFLFGREDESSREVLSKSARENGFGNSLFRRFLSNFDPELAPVCRLTAHMCEKVDKHL